LEKASSARKLFDKKIQEETVMPLTETPLGEMWDLPGKAEGCCMTKEMGLMDE